MCLFVPFNPIRYINIFQELFWMCRDVFHMNEWFKIKTSLLLQNNFYFQNIHEWRKKNHPTFVIYFVKWMRGNAYRSAIITVKIIPFHRLCSRTHVSDVFHRVPCRKWAVLVIFWAIKRKIAFDEKKEWAVKISFLTGSWCTLIPLIGSIQLVA